MLNLWFRTSCLELKRAELWFADIHTLILRFVHDLYGVDTDKPSCATNVKPASQEVDCNNTDFTKF
jgi:hypothetical protein